MGVRGLRFGLLTAVLAAAPAARADEPGPDVDRPVLVVTAAPPLDGERLADAVRAYLDELHVEVRAAPAAAAGELRGELAATARVGAAVRAWAVVRVADGAPGSVELEIVDRLTAKALLTTVPRPRRDEDLYRAVALKVQALLRATLAEPGAPVDRSPALLRLVAAPPPAPGAEEPRLTLETALVLTTFSGGGTAQQGLAVWVTRRFRTGVELALGTEALSAMRAESGAVSAVLRRVPLSLAARLARRGERLDLAAGLVAEATLVGIETSSSSLTVRSGWSVAPAVGAQAGARLRLASPTWLYLRASALGVIVAQRYTAQGQPLLALSGLELGAEAGLGVALW